MKVGVVTFPGTLDAQSTERAVELAGNEPVALWHGDADLKGVDAVILPGGASHGNYVRPGALAALSPIMEAIAKAAVQGMPVLGIGNGFQILCEANLLPGAFVSNQDGAYISRAMQFKVSNDSVWTREYEDDEVVTLPLRTANGLFVAAPEVIDELEESGRVVLRFEDDPTGSANAIAGIRNEAGNVVGLTASVDHAVEAGFGPATADTLRGGTDGLKVFTSVRAQ
ncbi:MAG: phosphoribosylformylglycinamidine synthase subunit PurQ [Actinomycetaceae bacterium]|nr:phosphoribosylformylglycinamidine synthase subunit PurQ [Actinomycetaceae bacterium]